MRTDTVEAPRHVKRVCVCVCVCVTSRGTSVAGREQKPKAGKYLVSGTDFGTFVQQQFQDIQVSSTACPVDGCGFKLFGKGKTQDKTV